MELQDCALPLLREVISTADPAIGFKDVDAAFLVGAMPRKEGMERKDLLAANVKIFKAQVHLLCCHLFKLAFHILLCLNYRGKHWISMQKKQSRFWLLAIRRILMH